MPLNAVSGGRARLPCAGILCHAGFGFLYIILHDLTLLPKLLMDVIQAMSHPRPHVTATHKSVVLQSPDELKYNPCTMVLWCPLPLQACGEMLLSGHGFPPQPLYCDKCGYKAGRQSR